MRLAFLNSTQYVAAALPAWTSASAAPASLGSLTSALRAYSPGIIIEPESDPSYVLIPAALIAPAVTWTLRTLSAQLDRENVYTVSAFDCEDFAAELCQTFRKMLARRGIPQAPLIGRIDVLQFSEWASVPSGGAHALVAAQTDEGIYIIEPQSGMHTPLSSYPNRASILRARGF